VPPLARQATFVSHNPYAPPKAAVGQPVTRVALPGRPKEVTLAVRLQWVSLMLGAVTSTANLARYPRAGLSLAGVTVVVALSFALVIWLTYKVSRGRNWARITLLVFLVLGMPGFLSQLPATFERSIILAATAVAILLLQCFSLYLVFIAAGARWFRRNKPTVQSAA